MAGSSTLSPPLKLPKAGSSNRSASAAKQRQERLRRRVCSRALGWRWPTTSPAALKAPEQEDDGALGAGRRVEAVQRELADDVAEVARRLARAGADPPLLDLERGELADKRRLDDEVLEILACEGQIAVETSHRDVELVDLLLL